MIIKNQSISHTFNALSYCEKGGELIYTHKCLGSTQEIFDQMDRINRQNQRCHKPTFHVKMRMAPEDFGKLTIQEELDILKRYTEKIGFDKNLYAIYIHKEGTPEQHFHIVASRILENNRAVSDSFYKFKNNDFCREIEEEFGLRKIERGLEKVRKAKDSLKEVILHCLDQSLDIEDFIFELSQYNIKVRLGRGITFEDEKGTLYSGSSIDRNLSLMLIESRFYNREQIAGENLVIDKSNDKGNILSL